MPLPIAVVGGVLAAATSLHFPVSTTNPQAQGAFDSGLFFYYAYNREAAHRSFADAATRDPRLAMAPWGMALADGPDLNTPMDEQRFTDGKHDIAAAFSLDAGAAPRERRFLSTMALRFAGRFGDWPRDDAAYARAMERFALDTKDENAALLAAEALLEQGGVAESRNALALVDEVLRDDPTSAMANHLCIHLYDLASDRRPARLCAQRLDAAVFPPEAEHLAHMPAHYWIEAGEYGAAVRSSDRAYALMERLETTPGGDTHAQQYLEHDVAVGYAAVMMLPNYATARSWAQRMASAEGIGFDGITALRFGDYQAAYDAKDPQYGSPAVKGWAALLLGHLTEAEEIAAHLEASKPKGGYMTPLFLARVAEARGDAAVARRWIAKASDEQRRDFTGELIPIVPASEQLGNFEWRSGNRAAAQSAFEETLAKYPNDPRAIAAIKALETGGTTPASVFP